MPRFFIEITDMLQRTVCIEADDEAQAVEIIEEACNDGIIELDATDFITRFVECASIT